MKTRRRLLEPGRLALFVLFGLMLSAVLFIWIDTAVTRNNCCPLIRPTELPWLTNPFYNPTPLAAVAGLIAGIWFVGSDRKKNDFLYLLLSFGLSFLMGWAIIHLSVELGIYTNAMLDNSPPQTHQAQVVDEWVRNGGSKLGALYFIAVTDWRTESGAPVEFRVDGFHTIEIGDAVRVTTGRGFLGYEWVRHIELD